jgi:hypothetical protein
MGKAAWDCSCILIVYPVKSWRVSVTIRASIQNIPDWRCKNHKPHHLTRVVTAHVHPATCNLPSHELHDRVTGRDKTRRRVIAVAFMLTEWTRVAQSVQWIAMDCTVCGSNPRFSSLVHTGPGAHLISYTTGTRSFPSVKRTGRGVDHPPASSAEVKERAELYLYYLSGPLWEFPGWNLPLPCQKIYRNKNSDFVSWLCCVQ